jgi:outer membrane protein assembly factor BamA
LEKILSKIVLLFVTGSIIYSCSSVKKVPEGAQLLTKNTLLVNEKTIKDERIESLLSQKPNSKLPLIGFPLRLSMYNMAKDKPDSLYYAWLERKPNRRKNLAKFLSNKQVDRLSESFIVSGFSNFLKRTGEAPVIIDEKRIQSSRNRLKAYYTFNLGYFDVEVNTKRDTVGKKKGSVTYEIITGTPSVYDTITNSIESSALEPLYEAIEPQSLIKKGNRFNAEELSKERERITNYFRENGVYYFQVNHIKYDIDTLNNEHRVNVNVNIEDRFVKDGDTLKKTPFRIYTINEVNIYTVNGSKKDINRIKDSVSYRNYQIYSDGKLNYKPKALTNAVFIQKGDLFSDKKRTLTTRSLGNLTVFNAPNIEYIEDPDDENGLISNIYLVPRKKFSWTPSIDFTHSNIQDFGITGSMSVAWRNVFKGAEILQFGARGNIGSSRDMANPNNVFFNIAEYGADIKLTFPRIVFPIDTRRIIKKEMLPTTLMSFGLTNQRNIGLDKENFTGTIAYNWQPKEGVTSRFDLANIQFVRNLNIENYFNVYGSSYSTLNDLAQIYNVDPNNINPNSNNLTFNGAINFIDQVVSNQTSLNPEDREYQIIRSIGERRKRLIENNLIIASSYSFTKTTKVGFSDNSFYILRAKIETAGNVASLLAREVNEPLSENGNETLLGVEYSQYIKPEADFVKHWDFGKKNVLAIRTFAGIAIPYGNANSIPFSRSYFGGGANDNRGWQAYSLGPGRSGAINDFNEANLKLAFSAEYRFNFFGQLNGALFADAGNIWNVFDNVTDPDYTFNGLKSLQDIALGTGIGFRYDFNFFVFRIDLGYKAYNPAKEMSERWFRDINLSRTVLNFGINYPF